MLPSNSLCIPCVAVMQNISRLSGMGGKPALCSMLYFDASHQMLPLHARDLLPCPPAWSHACNHHQPQREAHSFKGSKVMPSAGCNATALRVGTGLGNSCTSVASNTHQLTDDAAQKNESPVRSGLQRQNTYPLNPGHAAGNDSAESLDNLSDNSAR